MPGPRPSPSTGARARRVVRRPVRGVLESPECAPSLWQVAFHGDEVAGHILNYLDPPRADGSSHRLDRVDRGAQAVPPARPGPGAPRAEPGDGPRRRGDPCRARGRHGEREPRPRPVREPRLPSGRRAVRVPPAGRADGGRPDDGRRRSPTGAGTTDTPPPSPARPRTATSRAASSSRTAARTSSGRPVGRGPGNRLGPVPVRRRARGRRPASRSSATGSCSSRPATRIIGWSRGCSPAGPRSSGGPRRTASGRSRSWPPTSTSCSS